ncbi:DNA starvation/stationary phase protection protein Dps [Halorussus halophilus]|uniref:DNA starvation/stationary phase protection protein Dps n=1 Tax=Halorussus halophilus TaxID=2650975 RepID=UPI001300F585|nr:DNA starvation/stationary phase protection protein Dps [Halorussus halophilus]
MSIQPSQHQQSWFRTANDLSPQTRASSVELLNQSLADTTDLMTQLKYAHWNVKGRNFYQFHLLFDEIAEVLEEHADDIAERATELGGEATGTVRMAASSSRIPEIPERVTTGPEYVAALVERVAIHAANLRANIDASMSYGDQDTGDLYAELSREIDKQLWFLEAHQQARERVETPQATGQVTGSQPMAEQTAGNRQMTGQEQMGRQQTGQTVGAAMGQQTGVARQQTSETGQQTDTTGQPVSVGQTAREQWNVSQVGSQQHAQQPRYGGGPMS